MTNLSDQLIESQQFIKDFVKYGAYIKRTVLSTKINLQIESQKCLELEHYMEQLVNNINEYQYTSDLLSTDMNNNTKPKCQPEKSIALPIQFLLECVFLAILDSNGELL